MTAIVEIGLVALWLTFVVELFTMTQVVSKEKLAIVIWASARAIPLMMVSIGVF